MLGLQCAHAELSFRTCILQAYLFLVSIYSSSVNHDLSKRQTAQYLTEERQVWCNSTGFWPRMIYVFDLLVLRLQTYVYMSLISATNAMTSTDATATAEIIAEGRKNVDLLSMYHSMQFYERGYGFSSEVEWNTELVRRGALETTIFL